MIEIRPERPDDAAAVAALHAAAFGDDVVPRLVTALREQTRPEDAVSLVFLVSSPDVDGELAGHVLVTPIPLETAPGRTVSVPCLSPLAVLPAHHGRGIGGALVEAAVAELERRGAPLVLLEGSPRFYGRFGFVPASAHGLRRPSERTPEPAFQVRLLSRYDPDDPDLRGRVLYPRIFWELDAVGLPVQGPTWLDELERHCRSIEAAVAGGGSWGAAPNGAVRNQLAARVSSCPGWTVADVLAHLGVVARVAQAWIRDGRRPRPEAVPAAPAGDDVLDWFATGWRSLHALLADLPAEQPAATWSPWEASVSFWRRRMVHEHAVHALDVLTALGGGSGWTVPEQVAADGVEEALRLWLGTRLGSDAGGDGDVVRLVAGERAWTVGLHRRFVEVHELPVPADAVVSGSAAQLYRWLWRGGDVSGDENGNGVTVDGSRNAVELLRAALRRAMQ